MSRESVLLRRPPRTRRGRIRLWLLDVGLPQRRQRSSRLLDLFIRVGEALERAVDPEVAAWVVLSALTAGEGLGFNRAFLLLAHNGGLHGFFGVGPRSREEAFRLWAELSHHQVRPLERLLAPDPTAIAKERQRHANTLAALSLPSLGACRHWQHAFVAHANHPESCVRHWVEVLDSRALVVVPLLSEAGPWGVVLADNFVTQAPVYLGTLEAAESLAHALRAAVERTHLLRRLREEERRRVAAEHATALLTAARSLTHELVNPLSIAGGTARELLTALPAEQEVLAHKLAVIVEAVARVEKHVARLAEGLADRANGGVQRELELGELVERVTERLRPLAVNRHVRLVCCRPARKVAVAAIQETVEQCLETLVSNALAACESGRGEVQIAVFEEGEWGAVHVADTGPPLEPELSRAPFAGGISTRRSSSGLGLASLRALAEAMGGRVDYDESDPPWVRFVLRLRRWS